jgi:DNA-binding IscR family transcriptional regulator
MEALEPLTDEKIITEPQLRKLAPLPVLMIFYLSIQRQVSSTPVTPLEMAAYLDVDVRVVEAIFEYLEKHKLVRAFRQDLPAYSLAKELDEISVKDLLEILGEFHTRFKQEGMQYKPAVGKDQDKRYRKIYSELASEILQLFGEESANQLPL